MKRSGLACAFAALLAAGGCRPEQAPAEAAHALDEAAAHSPRAEGRAGDVEAGREPAGRMEPSLENAPTAAALHLDWASFDAAASRASWWVPGTMDLRLDGGMQRASEGEGGHSVVVLRDSPGKSERVGEVWVRDIAREVGALVRARVRQERVIGASSSAETWLRGTGDCTEIADLSAALLRARGVRARVAAGVAVQGGEPHWHAWVEYWDGRWSTLDPTWNEHPASVGHLRLDAAEHTGELTRLEAYIDARAQGALAGIEWRAE